MKINFKSLITPKNISILLVIILAAFLRLYKISDYMTFLGDEGRDVLVAKDILAGHFTLLGPRASAGDFFLGPIYYYFMAPFLWLFHLDPVGPAVMIALIGIATVFLTYKITKEFLGYKAAIFASALYAVSPIVINYSHSSWNPNPMPFVSLLTLYIAYKGLVKSSFKLFLIAGVLLGIGLQLHYLTMFLIAIVLFFIFFGNWFQNKKLETRNILKSYLYIFLGLIVGWSPFIAFEVRHGFPNIRTIFSFIFASGQTQYVSYGSSLDVWKDVFFRIFGRLIFRFPPPEQLYLFDRSFLLRWEVIIVIFGALSTFFMFKIKNKLVVILFSTWLFLGIFLFGFYKKSIYDYYFEFMFPLPFILLGNLLSVTFESSRLKSWGKPLALSVFLIIFIYNLNGMPFLFSANRQKEQVKTISQFVLSKTDDKPFNFALLTPGNSDYGYRYYFQILGKPEVRIDNLINDPKRKTVMDQLLVVCEDPNCVPIGASLFDISNFGRAEITGVWDVSVVKVYRLVHYHGK